MSMNKDITIIETNSFPKVEVEELMLEKEFVQWATYILDIDRLQNILIRILCRIRKYYDLEGSSGINKLKDFNYCI